MLLRERTPSGVPLFDVPQSSNIPTFETLAFGIVSGARQNLPATHNTEAIASIRNVAAEIKEPRSGWQAVGPLAGKPNQQRKECAV